MPENNIAPAPSSGDSTRDENPGGSRAPYLAATPTKAGGFSFAKNNPGRPKGIKDRRSREKEKLLTMLERGRGDLKPAFERWKAILLHAPWAVRESAERFLFEQLHGRAVQAITGPDGKDLFDNVNISFSPRGTIVETTKLED